MDNKKETADQLIKMANKITEACGGEKPQFDSVDSFAEYFDSVEVDKL